MKFAIGFLVACSLFIVTKSATAVHNDELFLADDDVVYSGCQDPKDQVARFGSRVECDLESTSARVCEDGTVILLADGETAPATCNVTPYVEGIWRRYNDNKDFNDVMTLPVCDVGQEVYICVGAPPQFKP